MKTLTLEPLEARMVAQALAMAEQKLAALAALVTGETKLALAAKLQALQSAQAALAAA